MPKGEAWPVQGVEMRRVRETCPCCCPQTCHWLPDNLEQTPQPCWALDFLARKGNNSTYFVGIE